MTSAMSDLLRVKEAARAGILVSAGARRVEFILPPEHSEDLLRQLQNSQAILASYQPDAPNIDRSLMSYDRMPVSDAQKRHLTAFRSGKRLDPYVTFHSSAMMAPLVTSAAARAALDLEARHGAFQYDIEERDGAFWHVRRTLPGVTIRTFDLSQTLPDHQPQALRDALSWLTAEASTFGREAHCRAAMVALSPNVLLFVVSIEHIFSDLFSVRIVLNDLMILYQRYLGYSVSLTAPADYLEHLRRVLEIDIGHLKFWSLYLAGAAQPQFPTRSEGPISHETQKNRFWVGQQSYATMKNIGAEAKCTMFAVVLAKLFILIRTMTGQSDITLGFLSANRDPNNLSLVGLVADTIFVRAQGGTKLDTEYVSYVWASLRAALRHAQTPRTMVTEMTGVGIPVVVVNFLSAGLPEDGKAPNQAASLNQAVSGLHHTVLEVFRENGKAMPQNLYLELIDVGCDLHIEVHYKPHYFGEEEYAEIHRAFSEA